LGGRVDSASGHCLEDISKTLLLSQTLADITESLGPAQVGALLAGCPVLPEASWGSLQWRPEEAVETKTSLIPIHAEGMVTMNKSIWSLFTAV
jgi:hypothetical protein